jgi:hypothetical protein
MHSARFSPHWGATANSNTSSPTKLTFSHDAQIPTLEKFIYDLILFVVYFLGVTTHCGCIFRSPVAGFSLLVFEFSWSHTTTRHSRYDSSGLVINPSLRPIPDNTQHSQQTNIHDVRPANSRDTARIARAHQHRNRERHTRHAWEGLAGMGVSPEHLPCHTWGAPRMHLRSLWNCKHSSFKW